MSLRFDTAVFSEPGHREVNQDWAGFAEADGFACWALADGLGGHGGGELAAHIAVDAVVARFTGQPGDPAPLLSAAQQAVLDGQKANPMQAQMRTTIVVLVAGEGGARWIHCGDSRLYLFRGGRVHHQTLDHSVPQSLVEAGKIGPTQIRNHEDRGRLLHSLGTAGSSAAAGWTPDIGGPVLLAPTDAFLLTSDGFWEWVTEIEMEAELAKATSAQAWLDGMRARIPPATPENDRDNATAIAIMINE
ncbi:MAG: protein phosphatase 2C domain-containing protein [Bryobacteraceae bacterium]